MVTATSTKRIVYSTDVYADLPDLPIKIKRYTDMQYLLAHHNFRMSVRRNRRYDDTYTAVIEAKAYHKFESVMVVITKGQSIRSLKNELHNGVHTLLEKLFGDK